jgi:hypothetical protein
MYVRVYYYSYKIVQLVRKNMEANEHERLSTLHLVTN